MKNTNDVEGKWAYSHNGENYSGTYDTREEAIAEGGAGYEGSSIWVGKCGRPPCEEHLHADMLIEHILCQDEWCNDWAEEAFVLPRESDEAMTELTTSLRRMFAEWLDKYKLRPSFFVIYEAEEVAIPEEQK